MKLHKVKIAIRNARKNEILSFAKLCGLVLSMAVVIFAAAYVYYEISYDNFIPDRDKIYRCIMAGKLNGNDADFAVTSPEMAPTIENEIPEIAEAIRILARGNTTLNYNEESINTERMLLAEANFFSFFSIPLITNVEDPFVSPGDITIAKSLAIKHFGSPEDALNKVLRKGNQDLTITGVFEDFPSNFHLQAGVIQSLKDSDPDKVGWGSQNYYTYFKTYTSGLDKADLTFKLTKTVYTHWDDELDGAAAKSLDDLKSSDDLYIFFHPEPLKEIHFSKHKFDPAVTSSKTYVYGAIILAILVLLISSINFINLSIANISTRLKEIGIRKSTGAGSKHIAFQIITESVLFWIVGFVLAFLVYKASGSFLERYLGFEVAISNSNLVKLIGVSFFILFLFNLLISIIPVSVVAKKRVLNLIKEEENSNKRFSWSNGFVFLQFALSALIILCSVFAQKQVNYMVNKDRGYDSDNIIELVMWEMAPQTRKNILDELKSYSQVKGISTSDVYFGEDPSMNSAFFETYENHFHTSVFPVDNGFLETYGITLVEGRYFDPERETDNKTVLLNEKALEYYSGEGSVLGKNVLLEGETYKVIVKDFNFRSLHHKIQPLVIRRIENFGNVSIKTSNAQIGEVVEILHTLWKKHQISQPFNYQIHDDILVSHFEKDQQAKKMLLVLSLISIAIACIGLYAISYFTIIRKTKEIGIRKVNGATVFELMGMINSRFLRWVVAAFIVAMPVSWYVMNLWLESFAYKTTLSWWIFALAGLLALGIALLTVSWQSWRAATRNPVEALRYE